MWSNKCKNRFPLYSLLLAGTVLLCQASCRRSLDSSGTGTPASSGILLKDVSKSVGITFQHTDGSSGEHYIIEPMSAGLALFDYDNDGFIDIYFLNGAPLPGYKGPPNPRNALYRNNGDWTFTDVTDRAGVGDTGYGLGVTVGDFDNDGDADLYLNNYGPNVFYRNNGDGTFTDITAQTGTAGPADYVGAGALFVDVDRDGLLDLYVGNYLRFDPSMNVVRMVDGMRSYPSPRDYLPIPDSLYRNNGNGTFTDISEESGIAAVKGTAMGMVAADVDNDGDTDIFVLNDVAENFLFINDGTGHFTESAIERGVAYNAYGEENASMGVDCGDVDHDGWLDFYMTAYEDELAVLYRNIGDGYFEDVTRLTGAGEGTYAHVNWGIGLVDLDNDGDLDVFIANGHTEDNIDARSAATAWRVRNLVLMNDGKGHFRNITDECGDGLAPVEASRGAAFADLDNDGDIDIVVLNSRSAPTIIENRTNNGNHWIQIILEGTKTNRDGVGSRVTLTAGDLKLVQEKLGGRGYQSYWGSRLHFGLGQHNHIDQIEVRWLSGTTHTIKNVPVDCFIRIKEGTERFEVLRLPRAKGFPK